MPPALTQRSIEQKLLDLLIVPNLPPVGCEHHGALNGIVFMGRFEPDLFAVRRITCPNGCAHETRRLRADTRIFVQAKLEIAASIVRELRERLEAENNQTGPHIAGPSTAQQEDTDEEAARDELDQGPPTKRRRLQEPERQPKFLPAKCRLTARARAQQTTLTLDSGEEVKGFDMTEL